MKQTAVALLVNRLSRDGDIEPKYIGNFNGVESLPKGGDASLPNGNYPPIYWWEDNLIGAVRLSFNTPLLERLCKEEASKAGVSIGDKDIGGAIETLNGVVTNAFQAMIQGAASGG